MSRARVLVIGSVNADLVVHVDRRPDPGETVLGGDLVTVPGGKGANQAVAAARLGSAVAFVGCVGGDGHGALLRESMSGAGIDLSALKTVDAPTGVALITVTPDGENSIVVSSGANARVSTEDIQAARPSIQTADILVLQLELPIPTVELAALMAASEGTRVILNLAPAQLLSRKVLAVCDPLVVNEHEAAFLISDGTSAGSISPGAGGREAVRRLLALGPRSVVITLGPEGAIVADQSHLAHVAAPKVDIVDTTGAGDAFVGALAGELARGVTLVEAAEYAVRVGAATVRTTGAQTSFPTADEVAAL